MRASSSVAAARPATRLSGAIKIVWRSSMSANPRRSRLSAIKKSTKLQYALADRAAQFGWLREQIVVIDDDLGRSGAGVEARSGLRRLIAEVGLGHVGLVFGLEMSRIGPSYADWYRLIDLCGLSDTLIADADGVYDPAHYNDRLLLGLNRTVT